MRHNPDDALWRFETARFFVGMFALPEDTPPEDTFEFQDDIDAVRSGRVDYFCAAVVVALKPIDDDNWRNWRTVGSDYLGCCAYDPASSFVTGHRDPDPMNRNCAAMRAARGGNVVICHYFPDMVREAIACARVTVGSTPSLRKVA